MNEKVGINYLIIEQLSTSWMKLVPRGSSNQKKKKTQQNLPLALAV